MVWLENGKDLTINQLEASWVSSLSSLGFPVGALLSSLFIDVMGKKWAAIFGQAGSYCIGYSLIAFAVNVECIYAGRFMCGICQVNYWPLVIYVLDQHYTLSFSCQRFQINHLLYFRVFATHSQ